MKSNKSNLDSLKHIAVLRLSAIGDVVLCSSMVLALARSEKYKVYWITTEQSRELLGDVENVEFIIVPKPKNFSTLIASRNILKKYSFDCLLLTQASFSAHLVSLFVKSKRKIGFDKSRSKDLHGFFINERIPYKEEHFVDAYYSFASRVGINKPDIPSWDGVFALDKSSICKKLPKGKPILAVNPQSSKIERNWDLNSYVNVIKYSQEIGFDVIIIGGNLSSEIEFNKKVETNCISSPLNLTGNIKLSELPSLIECCDVLLAPDTGSVHIATSLGKPVVGLYAVANSKLTGPYRSSRFSIDRFRLAFENFSSSRKFNFYARIHDHRAMDLITVEDVCLKIKEVIAYISEKRFRMITKFFVVSVGFILSRFSLSALEFQACFFPRVFLLFPSKRKRLLFSNLTHAFPKWSDKKVHRIAFQSTVCLFEMGFFSLVYPHLRKFDRKATLSISESVETQII